MGERVFASKVGTPVGCHNLINRSWRPLLKGAGLPRIPFHNLKHTCASLLLSQGVHPKLVQELLGHADIRTTLNTYSHVIPDVGEEERSSIEVRRLPDAVGSPHRQIGTIARSQPR